MKYTEILDRAALQSFILNINIFSKLTDSDSIMKKIQKYEIDIYLD